MKHTVENDRWNYEREREREKTERSNIYTDELSCATLITLAIREDTVNIAIGKVQILPHHLSNRSRNGG